MTNVLSTKIQNWLSTPRAKDLAEGAACNHGEVDLMRSLCMKFENHSVVNPLTAASRNRLQRLIDDPQQEVEDAEAAMFADEAGLGRSGLVRVDASAMDGTVIYRDELSCGRGCHGNHPHVAVTSYLDGSFVVAGQYRWAGIHTSGGDFRAEFTDRDEAIIYAKSTMS